LAVDLAGVEVIDGLAGWAHAILLLGDVLKFCASSRICAGLATSMRFIR
jgi:hypothetical protein